MKLGGERIAEQELDRAEVRPRHRFAGGFGLQRIKYSAPTAVASRELELGETEPQRDRNARLLQRGERGEQLGLDGRTHREEPVVGPHDPVDQLESIRPTCGTYRVMHESDQLAFGRLVVLQTNEVL